MDLEDASSSLIIHPKYLESITVNGEQIESFEKSKTKYFVEVENKVKKVALISKVERLIMMIAVGCLKDSYGVAYSARNPTKDILIKH